ncbi:MAG: lysylphosphatidylglycerol synthase transmembrane domain-containing protein [Acidobacteriota bacterium]
MSIHAARALRVGGSVILLTAVIWMLPRGELQNALGQASPWVLSIAVTAFVLCHAAAAFKWRMLMGRSTDLSLGKAVRAHFTGLVATLSPLGMIGGDLVRAGVAINGSTQSSTIMLTGVVDRIVDTAALMVLALAGFAWIGGRSTAGAVVLWGGIAVSVAGAGVLFAGHALLRRTHHARLTGIRNAFDVLMKHPALIVRAFLLSVFIQGMFVATIAYIGESVGVESSFAAWLFAFPAAKVAASLPIGVAGIGVRELALVALLGPLGGAAGPVLAAGLLWDAVLIVGSLGGWLTLRVVQATLLTTLHRVQQP